MARMIFWRLSWMIWWHHFMTKIVRVRTNITCSAIRCWSGGLNAEWEGRDRFGCCRTARLRSSQYSWCRYEQSDERNTELNSSSSVGESNVYRWSRMAEISDEPDQSFLSRIILIDLKKLCLVSMDAISRCYVQMRTHAWIAWFIHYDHRRTRRMKLHTRWRIQQR